ncbi:serine hydrolase domain-containing protein [Paracraurococcus lichenis]|uniref:Serine hydrolase domain-containing protein n=1 Tax=Paracraurococcus lichenis TaxID=3064888 RepID=A0ABT9DT98_9PROT|nr:serine hydrolase domain-containing protein [Paracraurococcus sp. LOR1-02]MDO9707123.1 serine hydrolase domain-containing protein [Paracraurococcus sp. LOR1-02]
MSALPTASPEEVGLSTARLQALGARLDERIAAGHLPGAVVSIARNGRVAWTSAHGRRDPARGAPMTADAIFRIYSMTKPLVSVGVMMLVEEGRLMLGDPVGKYLPELAAPVVAMAGGNVPAVTPITVQDLLRHTSGLTYEFLGTGPVHRAYAEAGIARREQTNAEQVAMLGRLPLLHQPGTQWGYSRSTDVLGRLIEVVSGGTLGAFLQARICRPLGMVDTGFHVPPAQQHRLAEGLATDPDTGEAAMQLLEVREPPRFESGGGGLVGTAADYMRFTQLLAGGGELLGTRLLSRKTVELMSSDHLGGIPGDGALLPPGHGFGLGFAVRRDRGIATAPGSVGTFFWSGMAGTFFWIDPAERLIAVFMMQGVGQREYYRNLIRNLVYAAVAD